MRVTKLIREYVEEEVNKTIPVSHLCPEYEEMDKAVDAAIEKINEQMKVYGEKLVADAKTELNIPDDWEFCLTERSFVESSSFLSELNQRSRELYRKAKDKRTQAVKEILLELELGATKSELTEIISRVTSK